MGKFFMAVAFTAMVVVSVGALCAALALYNGLSALNALVG